MLSSVKFMQKKADKLSSNEATAEWWLCRRNPFYFIFNYVCISEIGGILKYEESRMHSKIKRTVRSVARYHKCILMASRQLGKALSLKTIIPMPNNNYKFLKDISVGDYVLDEYENPTRVVADTEIMFNRPCYNISFSNGQNVDADENHLWKVNYSLDSSKLITTKEIYELKTKEYYVEIFIVDRFNNNIYIDNIQKINSVPVKCIQVENKSGMFLCTYSKIPTHNSTIAASLLEWACNFYPRMPATILNANKTFALENLEKVKFTHTQLPAFLRTPLKYKGERKTTIDYKNDSVLRVFYPSSTTSPSMLARSLTSPILYIDESAHIPHMRVAYGSAQPVLSRAREQARKNNYPYYTLVTSTPNGTVGTGEWFYQMWNNAIDSDLIFDDNDLIVEEEAPVIVDDPEKNGFIKIRFHWSEDPEKGEEWYQEQRKDLNFDTRNINQELDLVFVGSTRCIFDDDLLSRLLPSKSIDRLKLIHTCNINLYLNRLNFDVTDYFIIGIDTAKSLTGDYNAIQIFSYANFIQCGEYFGKLGSITKYSDVIISLIDILAPIVNNRIILAIENNSIGTSIIENLENANTKDKNYSQYIYSPEPNKYIGINTNTKTKGLMVSHLYNLITDNPKCINSSDLINQLNIIERKINGSISAQSGYNDDLFMSAALCAYVRKISALEFEPLLGVSTILQEKTHIQKIQNALKTSLIQNVSPGIAIRYNQEEGGIEYIIDDNNDDGNDSEFFTIF